MLRMTKDETKKRLSTLFHHGSTTPKILFHHFKSSYWQLFDNQHNIKKSFVKILTNKLFHFVSPLFHYHLINNTLTQNLVSLVSSVSHLRETRVTLL
ncbi:MAG: hypothetical protein JWR23_1759 [Mucilaginibacter sp.]|nr:hypothetical protein [Mucilaginibacter sp.]